MSSGTTAGTAGPGEVLHTGPPDVRETAEAVEAVVVREDVAVGRSRLVSTHTGRSMGTGSTGRRVGTRGTDVVRVADGRITDCWFQEATPELLRQPGALPPTEEPLRVRRTT